jgi:hypothetical protein
VEELSTRAASALRRLDGELTPAAGADERTWARLQAAMAADVYTSARRQWWRPARRAYRVAWSYARRYWIIGTVLCVFALVVVPVLRGDGRGATTLAAARSQIEEGEYALAYRMLAAHARSHRTRDAAEARMPLMLDALCGMGREEDADEQLERYLAVVPDSAHRDRRLDVCAAAPSEASD